MKTTFKASLIKYLTILASGVVLLGFYLAFLHYREANRDLFRHDLEDIRRTGVLRVIVEKDPTGYRQTGIGDMREMQIQMVRRYAQWAGIPQVTFKEQSNLAAAIDTLLHGRADLLAWNIPVYGELKESIAYTHPVLTSRQVLIQRIRQEGDSTDLIRNQLDLAGKTIYLQAGSPYRGRMENLAREIGDTIYIRELPNAQLPDLLTMMLAGDIDYTVCDEFLATLLTQEMQGLDHGTAISFAQNYSWAVDLESIDLQESLDQWLAEYLQSEGYKILYKQYIEKKP
ncbi:MAG: transporter substrate-binding domain-containing protein [Paludibacteraceae bacterium]|nr:transporter substrate-binding domain-containing protein [Paludibacteraceae bacterium]